MATGDQSSVTERCDPRANEYGARCDDRPYDPAPAAQRAGDTVLPAGLSIEFSPAARQPPLDRARYIAG